VKITAACHDLLAELQTVSRVASTRSAVQALSGVQLVVADGSVQLRATDMDMGLRVPLTAEIERDGTVVLPARLLLDVVRSLPGERVSIELRPAEQDVELTSASATFHIRTLRAEDFPPLPEPAAEGRVVLPADAVVATIARVERSASHDETRPILTGILMSVSGTDLKMVATDSYRLSVKETTLQTPVDPGFEANVPAPALAELSRLAADATEISITVRENQVAFEIGDRVLSSRLIDGQFPNYNQLLPDSYEHELRVDGHEIADVVRRISLMAQKNAPLRLRFAEGELTVSAQTPDVGEAQETVPVPFAGEAFEIGFNPEFLRDGLESAESGEIILKLISPLRPGLIESGDGGGFLYLIMPIRLNV
jgi:DNA polymerase III subunit beta